MRGLHVLGIDIGTTNTKAVIVDIGSVVDVARASTPTASTPTASTPTASTATGLVDGVLQVVREVLGRTGIRPQAVGIASMAETGVPLDRDGRPLTELLRWDGHRAADEAAALAARHGRAELFRATGVRPSAKVPLATFAWLAAHEPDVFARMAGWAGAADLVGLALTGELVTDHTLAGRTMAYRLPARGEPLSTSFDADLLATVGLRPEQLPRVAPPDSVAGHHIDSVHLDSHHIDRPVSSRVDLGRFWGDAARSFAAAGLVPGTPVVIAGHDHAVGAWAAGVRHAGDRADSLGTAEAVLTVLPDLPAHGPDLDAVAAAGMSWVRTVSGRHDAILAGSSSAGAMVAWLVERTGESAAELLADALADLERNPEPTGLIVLPYLSGRQSPAPDPAARVHAPEGVTGPRLTRAVLEGICLQARWMLTAQEVLAGGSADRLRPTAAHSPLTVLGGPALANPAWTLVKRRVVSGPMRWVTADEPVAAGAALLAATRAGLLGRDVRSLLSAGSDRPDGVASGPRLPTHDAPPTAPAAYDGMYDRYVATALAGRDASAIGSGAGGPWAGPGDEGVRCSTSP